MPNPNRLFFTKNTEPDLEYGIQLVGKGRGSIHPKKDVTHVEIPESNKLVHYAYNGFKPRIFTLEEAKKEGDELLWAIFCSIEIESALAIANNYQDRHFYKVVKLRSSRNNGF